MAKLYLVRHGKTLWSGTGRYQGFSDIPLSAEGQLEAGRLARRLAPENFTAIYCSDLTRASQTAQAMAPPRGKEIVMTPDLRELNFGLCEGLTFQQISERYPEGVTIWRGREHAKPFPGGESLQQLAERISRFLQKLPQADMDEKTLIVSHTGALSVMVCLLLGIGLDHWWQFKTANCSLSIVQTSDRGAVLSLLNDLGHLTEPN